MKIKNYSKKIYSLLNGNYGYDELEMVGCIVTRFLKDFPEKMFSTLKDLSSNGDVKLVSIRDSEQEPVTDTPFAIMKSVEINEILTGLLLNSLRKEIQNYMFLYGGLMYGEKLLSFSEVVPGMSFNDYIIMLESGDMTNEFVTMEEFNNILKQIIAALYIAQLKFDFVHGDLHPGNVMITFYENPVTLTYDLPSPTGKVMRKGIKTHCVAKIIDYGGSIITYKGQRIAPPLDNALYGIKLMTDPEFFPLFDICRLTSAFEDTLLTPYKNPTVFLSRTSKMGSFYDFSNLALRLGLFKETKQTLDDARLYYGTKENKYALFFLAFCFPWNDA